MDLRREPAPGPIAPLRVAEGFRAILRGANAAVVAPPLRLIQASGRRRKLVDSRAAPGWDRGERDGLRGKRDVFDFSGVAPRGALSSPFPIEPTRSRPAPRDRVFVAVR